MTRGYMAVGPMAPFYVFPCGHAFHAQCLIAHVTRCTNQAQVSNRSVFSCSASSHHLNSGCTALSSHLFIYVRAHFYCLICILHYWHWQTMLKMILLLLVGAIMTTGSIRLFAWKFIFTLWELWNSVQGMGVKLRLSFRTSWLWSKLWPLNQPHADSYVAGC